MNARHALWVGASERLEQPGVERELGQTFSPIFRGACATFAGEICRRNRQITRWCTCALGKCLGHRELLVDDDVARVHVDLFNAVRHLVWLQRVKGRLLLAPYSSNDLFNQEIGQCHSVKASLF